MANTEQAVCDPPQYKPIAESSEMGIKTDGSGSDWDDRSSEEESEYSDSDCNGISAEEIDHSRIISDGLSLKMANTEQAGDDSSECKPIAKTSETVTETDDSGSDWDDSSSEEECEYSDSDCNGISEEEMDHSRIISDGLSLKMANTEQAVCDSIKLIAKTSTMDTESEDSGCDWEERIISDCQSLELSNEEQAVCGPPQCKLIVKTSEMVTETDDNGSAEESEYSDSDCNGIIEEEMDHSRIISDGLSLKMANTEQAVCDPPQYKPIAKTSTIDTETDDSGCDCDERIISDCQSLELSNEEQAVCDLPQYKLIAKTPEMVTETDDSGCDWDERIISDCQSLKMANTDQAVCDPPQCKPIAKTSEMVTNTETDDSGSDWDDSSSEEESEYSDSDCNDIRAEEIDHSRIVSDGLSLKMAITEQVGDDSSECKPIAKTSETVTETDDSGSDWDDISSEGECEYSDSDCNRISEEEMDHSRMISDCLSLKTTNTEQAVDDPPEYKLSAKASEIVGAAEASKGSGSDSGDFSIKTKHAGGTAAPSSQLMQHQYLEELMKKQQRSLDRPSFIRRLRRIMYPNPACDTSVDITVAMETPEDNSAKAFGPRDDFVRRCGDKPKLSQEDYLLEVVCVQNRPWNRFF
jgi:hypothetical protein